MLSTTSASKEEENLGHEIPVNVLSLKKTFLKHYDDSPGVILGRTRFKPQTYANALVFELRNESTLFIRLWETARKAQQFEFLFILFNAT
ncbi:MAG: hypothetical protein K9H84_01785 [Bacteroidales bacterium]|nr:hypothetical protein [Bacteroidales bacterium]